MARQARFPKSLSEKLGALDDHLFLLRSQLEGFRNGEPAYLRAIATELRTLVCYSSGTEGLVWRLADELNVSDQVFLCEGGRINRDHPRARSLQFYGGRNFRGEHGPPWLPRVHESLRFVLKSWEAVYVPSISDIEITHEYLIKAVAQQIGSAHEDEGVEPVIARLRDVVLIGPNAFAHVLVFDSDLTLQIGERILDASESRDVYHRRDRVSPCGDVTIAIRLGLQQSLGGVVHVISARSLASEVETRVSLSPLRIGVSLEKRGDTKSELDLPRPERAGDLVLAISYSSARRFARVLVNDREQVPPFACNLGWVDARELEYADFGECCRNFLSHWGFFLYGRLLSTADCGELLSSPFESLQSLMVPISQQNVFPD